MGKTFRREKISGPRPGKLHTHRDLPDIQNDLFEDWDEDDEVSMSDEDLYGKLRTKKQIMVRREDESSGEVDKG